MPTLLKDTEQLSSILNEQLTRRLFMDRSAKTIGSAFFATQLVACGSSSEPNSASPEPTTLIPAASAEYTTLKRTSFGVQQDALQSIEQLGVSQYLDQQLDYTNIDDGDLEAEIAARFPLVAQTPEQLLAGFPDNIGDVVVQMTAAAQFRQIYSERQLYEVMVEFWNNHFSIDLRNGFGPVLKPIDDVAVIRPNAMGNFRDLLHASAKSSAMLFYLDNFLNLSTSPNENYARELMELHTLGVDGGYTELDVKEVARCFTGWTIRFPGDPTGAAGTFKFEPAIHDDNSKTVLGQFIAAGGAQSDGEAILDLLALHPSTAAFIAQKLCVRFVSDSPPAELVDLVAEAFIFSDGDIRDTLRALFSSAEFLNSADQKIVRPVEYLSAMIRSLVPNRSYPTDNGILFYFAQSILGQLPHHWPTPDGYPDDQNYWSNTGNMLNRWRLAFLAVANIVPSIDVFGLDYGNLLDGASTPSEVVDSIAENVLMRPIASTDKGHLLDWIASTYNLEANDPIDANTAELLAGLVAAALFSSTYFQLR